MAIIPALLALFGFLALGLPLSRFQIGPVPIYFVDLVAASLLLLGFRYLKQSLSRRKKVSLIVGLIWVSLLPTFVGELFRMSLLESIYTFLRTTLHLSAIWTLSGLFSRQRYLQSFLIGATFGALLTSTIAVTNSLPVTGPWVRANVFTIDTLKPVSERFVTILEKSESSLVVEAQRGNSLVGKSNVTGGLLATFLPFILGAASYFRGRLSLRLLRQATIILTLFALLFTYSRTTYLALFGLALVYLMMNPKFLGRRAVAPMLGVTLTIAIFGFQSDEFKFDYLIEKFDLTSQLYAYTNNARWLSYSRPIEAIQSDPAFLFRGAGVTSFKLRSDDPDASMLHHTEGETHSVFGASIFYRGLFATVLIFYFLFYLAAANYRAIRLTSRGSLYERDWMLLASMGCLVALMPFWAFTHFLIDKMNGHMHLFVLGALILTGIETRYQSTNRKSFERSGRHRFELQHGA
ncbi:MAG: hypothetical protein CBB97_23555 [Candidatus Endolissoclinum sp. TMED37]|nr:MAG: hypothetical protein CBB97_23555 [Candidatus Endolissoclinum sp. TMED37]